MNNIERFITCVMKDFECDENNIMVKYYNKNFDLLVQKKKDGNISNSCVVIDKRNKPIIYNNIELAMKKLNCFVT
jgi:hypothetical protein